jgi:hypothetical protein
MRIIKKENQRILIKDDATLVDISDKHIIQYNAIHYIPKNKSYEINEVETRFIGKIETERADQTETTGIYIIPLYVWSNTSFEWLKITNYEPPKNKYFFYPHLLMLPHSRYHYQPLYFIHTCVSANLKDYEKITKTIDLDYLN